MNQQKIRPLLKHIGRKINEWERNSFEYIDVRNINPFRNKTENVYLFVCHVQFPAQGAGFCTLSEKLHMTDEQINFSV